MDKRKKELGLISYLFLQSGGHMWSDIIHNSENSRRKEGNKTVKEGSQEKSKSPLWTTGALFPWGQLVASVQHIL